LEKGILRCESCYFVSSLVEVAKFVDVVRRHWSVENQLHWRLDVTFGEDSCRVCKGCSVLNWNVFRKVALPLLRNVDVGGRLVLSVKCSWRLDVTILEKILF